MFLLWLKHKSSLSRKPVVFCLVWIQNKKCKSEKWVGHAAPRIRTAADRLPLLEILCWCVAQILIFSQTLTGTKNILLHPKAPVLVHPQPPLPHHLLARRSFHFSPSPFALFCLSWFSLLLCITYPFVLLVHLSLLDLISTLSAACFSCSLSMVTSRIFSL